MLPPCVLLVSALLLLLLHHTASHLSSGPHIADVNVLLPPRMTHPVEYRLQGSDGCFKWSWDHHDILSVVPEHNSSISCSTSARLKSIATYDGRKETAVYATDLNTGMVIRCKVYIDAISRIQIFHSSIKLDLDGLSTLRVRAFDSEENVFSSLTGLQFSWKLMPEVEGFPQHLAHVPLEESPLSDCGGLCGDFEIQMKLEESGVHSDLYVVRGIGIGHEIVSVHLLEPSFQHLEDKIVITVAEAMSLDPPSPVFVLVGALINYSLKIIRNNSPYVVNLPSPYHQWSALNSSVALVERKTGKVSSVDIGSTTIIVEDTRVVGHMQISSFHVVLPDSMLMFISPLSVSGELTDDTIGIPSVSRWFVVSGRQYVIHVKVFSPGPGTQEIIITENDDVDIHDNDPDFWNTFSISEAITSNRQYRILIANSFGLGSLTATLAYSSGQGMRKETLKAVQEVMVCDEVKFNMELENDSEAILLPWVPGVYQELELKVIGGCAMSSSDYKWFSSDMTTVSISASGIVQSKKPGKVTIRAVSIVDSLNYDEIVVEVTSPSSIVMLPDFPVETSVGTHLHASVTFKASSGSNFYACDAFRSLVRWKTESDSFLIANETFHLNLSNKSETGEFPSSSIGPPCAWTFIYASSHGRSVVHASLTKEHQQVDQNIVLKTSVKIAAFSPLIVHQANDGNQFGGYWFDLVRAKSQNQLTNLDVLYLAPGAHMDVMLHGGPERWNQDVEFIETAEALDERLLNVKDRVFLHQLPTIYGMVYRIGCEGLGTFKLVFRRGNLIGKDHPLPVVVEVWLSLVCSFPSAIVIIADEAFNEPQILRSSAQDDRMQGGIHATPVTVANDRRIRVSSAGISASGKAFANSSSLDVRWELTGCEGLVLPDDAFSSLMAKSSWERFFILQNASGLCVIRSTVVDMTVSEAYPNFNRILEKSLSSLTDAIQLQLVSSLRVSPEFSLLFFSSDSRLNFSITGGSCFLEIVANDTHIIEVIQQSPDYQCSQLIVAPKRLGYARVTVHDTGLVPPLIAHSTIQVADIEWIKITTGEHISVMLGSLQHINFLVGIDDGRSFDYSQYVYMNVCVYVKEDIVKLVDTYDSELVVDGCVHAPNFTVQATRIGVTTMYLSAVQHSGHKVSSHPIKLEVYAPPRIHPSDIFLVPGASFVLTIRGGPQIGSHAQYSSGDSRVAQVHTSTGRTSAISPGNSTIAASIYGDGDILLCQTYAIVRVGIPSSAVLTVQSDRLAVGRRMQIHPSLSEGNLFSFYELCRNFKWSIEDKEVLNFYNANQASEIEHDNMVALGSTSSLKSEKDFNFIRVLHGLSAGKTNITISFSCDFRISDSLSKSVIFSASRLLHVVSDLPLDLGSPITWILPPHYTSSNLLPQSSPRYNKGESQTDEIMIAYSLLGQCRKTEEVLDTSISINGAKIITKGFDNLECIQAKDRSSGRTEVASCVRVAEVAQIRIMTDELPVYMLAVGDEIEFLIKYHDALGNPFHEAHNISLFEAETDNPDVISIGTCDHGGNICVLAKSQGIALLQIVFINNPTKSDHVVISVGPQLYPQNPVINQGTKLKFGIKGLSDLASGQWFSSNSSIVHVEKLSGKAEAIREGQTNVHFKSSSLMLHTMITVLGRNTVLVQAPNEILTNMPFPVKYAFSVKFSDAYTSHHESAGNDMIFLFECEVDPPQLGFSKPWKDLVTGNLFCLFFPYSPEHLACFSRKSGDIGRHISVHVRASCKEEHCISGSASAIFVGGFSILEMDKNSLHLNMTPDSNKSVITVIGNTDVNIDWHEKDHLSVTRIHTSNTGQGMHVQYEIKVLGAKRFTDQLIFSLPATDQRAEIDVVYEPNEREAVVKAANFTSWVGVAGIFLILILTVTLLIYFLDRSERSRPVVSFGTPSETAPVTPERTSPFIPNNQSPRTPQPFIDYVRRTLDETPYYRQDFRRRINPQNTY